MFIWKHNQQRCNPYAAYIDQDGTKHLRVPADLYEEIPEPAAPEDYSEETYYRTEVEDAPYVTYTKKSEEQLAELAMSKAKIQREQAVQEITVTTAAGNEFDGDEKSQDRMTRAIAAMSDTDTVPWVLADNSIIQVQKSELVEALKLAGMRMTELWVIPYSQE